MAEPAPIRSRTPRSTKGNGGNAGAAKTKEAILRAAARLFRERGFADTTTRDIAEIVGIRGPSIYYHFETKHDLLFGVCRESLRRLTVAIHAMPDQANSLENLRL